MNAKTAITEPLMIAHAGGGYADQNYTNSIQALQHNYDLGFRFFEMDFSWTADGQLVCLHDWKKTFKKIFKKKIKAPITAAEFEHLAHTHPEYTACTLDTLAAWVLKHPDAKIITDIKDNNLEGIKLILTKYPQLQLQLIPQFYQPEEYPVLKSMGFKHLIWILYQYQGSKKSILQHSQEMELMAVSMRVRQAQSATLQQLLQWHRIFVYTVNQEKTKNKLVNRYGVSGIYTDFLPH